MSWWPLSIMEIKAEVEDCWRRNSYFSRPLQLYSFLRDSHDLSTFIWLSKRAWYIREIQPCDVKRVSNFVNANFLFTEGKIKLWSLNSILPTFLSSPQLFRSGGFDKTNFLHHQTNKFHIWQFLNELFETQAPAHGTYEFEKITQFSLFFQFHKSFTPWRIRRLSCL